MCFVNVLDCHTIFMISTVDLVLGYTLMLFNYRFCCLTILAKY